MNTIGIALPVSRGRPPIDAQSGGPDAGGNEQIPLLARMLRVALRWKKVVAAIVAGCLLIGLILTFLSTPQYTATSTIEIAREANKVVNIQGVEQEASATDQEFYQTQYGLLKSRALAERVAVELKLHRDAAFFTLVGDTKTADAITAAGRTATASDIALWRRRAGEILLEQLTLSPVRLSRLVNISFTSPDAALSTRVVNAWATNFIQSTLERRFDAASYARKFLEGRLESTRQRLEESERSLVNYASEQQIINLPSASQSEGRPTTERSLIAEDLGALNAELTRAMSDRITAEARYREQQGAGTSPESLANVAIVGLRQKRSELAADRQRLLIQFEPEYPGARALASQIAELDKAISREEGRVASSLANNYKESVARERELASKVDTLKTNLLELRRRSIQYNIFQRDVDTNRQLYDGLLQRYKEVGISGGVGTNNVSIVDEADIPEKPSSPRLLNNLLQALLIGIALGGLAALLLEQIDETIDNPGDVERKLGLPLLGAIPIAVGTTPLDALRDRKSPLVEAYIAVQTNLEFSTEHGVPRSIAISSAQPAEGKSTTALALAAALARAHKRVILVDGDMRSPSVHKVLGLSNERGLSNYLAGHDDLVPLIQPVEDFNFAAIAAGPPPPNAAELLTGSRLSMFINRLLEDFDHVVIDSPPVVGLADSPLIGNRVEGVIFAIEAHKSRSSAVRVALHRLVGSNAHVIGVLLTKFQSKRAAYGYGYDYGYGYGKSATSDTASD